MPVDRESDSRAIAAQESACAAQSGFTDAAFDARYAGGRSAGSGSGGNGTTGRAQAKPAGPRSRNSYMRARARRLAAAAPS